MPRIVLVALVLVGLGGLAAVDAPAQAHHSPVFGTAIQIDDHARGAVITIDRGADHGVTRGWRGHLIDATGAPVAGGRFGIAKVQARVSFAIVAMRPAAVRQTLDLKLYR
jgi:hypothetical protein